jgi:hypothetical protein
VLADVGYVAADEGGARGEAGKAQAGQSFCEAHQQLLLGQHGSGTAPEAQLQQVGGEGLQQQAAATNGGGSVNTRMWQSAGLSCSQTAFRAGKGQQHAGGTATWQLHFWPGVSSYAAIFSACLLQLQVVQHNKPSFPGPWFTVVLMSHVVFKEHKAIVMSSLRVPLLLASPILGANKKHPRLDVGDGTNALQLNSRQVTNIIFLTCYMNGVSLVCVCV